MILSGLRRLFLRIRAIAYGWNDYLCYAGSIRGYRRLAKAMHLDPEKGTLLIVSLRGMNEVWAQKWTLLSLAARAKGYRAFVLTSHSQRRLNRYYRLLGIIPIYFEDFAAAQGAVLPVDYLNDGKPKVDGGVKLPREIAVGVSHARTLDDFRKIRYIDAPIGEIALSTYSRHAGTGLIDLSKQEVRQFLINWLSQIVQSIDIANIMFERYNVRVAFFTEVFLEEYGAFYYAALSKGVNVIRFAGTVRDDAIIVQHLSRNNDRSHHASISAASWEWVKAQPYTSDIDQALHNNFMDRYGDRWHRSKRNQPGTEILEPNEARQQLGIAPDRKVAVIYSHILYDTLFFFGTDLFSDYAEWLVETVRVACANPGIDWLIKVHPSNLWRGEMNSMLKGRHEEERLIEQAIGKLPSHVRVVPASTKINPYTWFQMADYGITVRGTSGLEMAALGKRVITAGTGRYEGNGFTIDPTTKEAYLECLSRLPDLQESTKEELELAKRYAYSVFVLKPFFVNSAVPRLKTGKSRAVASDDIIYKTVRWSNKYLPADIRVFSDWMEKNECQDLLNKWGTN